MVGIEFESVVGGGCKESGVRCVDIESIYEACVCIIVPTLAGEGAVCRDIFEVVAIGESAPL